MRHHPVVLFDLDGTLTDPKVGITRCISHALQSMGRIPPRENDLLFAIGPPLRDSFKKLIQSDDPQVIEQAMQYYRDRFSSVGLFENSLYAGVPEMLAALKSDGYRLLLATAKPHVYAHRILEHFNLRSHFAGVYGSELDGRRQHKHELLAYLLAREKIDSTRQSIIMVGDRSHDIEAARANGCHAIGVSWGYGNSQELRSADYICDLPGDMVKVIARWPLRTD